MAHETYMVPSRLLKRVGRVSQREGRIEVLEHHRAGSPVSMPDDGADPDKQFRVQFSSSEPVLRPGYYEQLSHAEGAADLDRVSEGLVGVYTEHQGDQVGVVEDARIETDRERGVASLRFGHSDYAQAVRRDVETGIRNGVSFGYEIDTRSLALLEENHRESGLPLIAVQRWSLREISLAGQPADPNGRVLSRADIKQRGTTVTDQTRDGTDDTSGTRAGAIELSGDAVKRAATAIASERGGWIERVRDEYGQFVGVGELCTEATRDATLTREAFFARLESIMEKPEVARESVPSFLGLGGRERKRYSMLRALRCAYSLRHPALGRDEVDQDFSFELECHRAVLQRTGAEPRGILVPHDVLEDASWPIPHPFGRRQMSTVGEGALVATEHLAASFIEALREVSGVTQLGATMLTGLTGNVSIPKQTGVGAWSWVPEGGTIAVDSNLTTGAVTLEPHQMGNRQSMTRRLLKQSDPSVDALVRADMVAGAAVELDRVVHIGTGTNDEPLGIRNQPDVQTVSMGAAPAITWAEWVEFETAVFAAKGLQMGATGYLVDGLAWGTIKTTERSVGSGRFIMESETTDTVSNNYRVRRTHNAPASGITFGVWPNVLIGMWGGLDVQVDPYTAGDSGGLIMRAWQDIDAAVRHGEAFAIDSRSP